MQFFINKLSRRCSKLPTLTKFSLSGSRKRQKITRVRPKVFFIFKVTLMGSVVRFVLCHAAKLKFWESPEEPNPERFKTTPERFPIGAQVSIALSWEPIILLQSPIGALQSNLATLYTQLRKCLFQLPHHATTFILWAVTIPCLYIQSVSKQDWETNPPPSRLKRAKKSFSPPIPSPPCLNPEYATDCNNWKKARNKRNRNSEITYFLKTISCPPYLSVYFFYW